jgi:hypothetical protein
MMLPEAHVSHCTIHRLRIRIPSKRGSNSFFRTMEKGLSTLPGIESVEVNPLTGSVLVCHRSDTISICELIRQRCIVNLKEGGRKRTTSLRQDISQGVRAVNTHVSCLTGGKIDLLDVVGLYLIGAGAYQLIKGNFMAPAWYTAFWYAFGILSKAPSGDKTSEE